MLELHCTDAARLPLSISVAVAAKLKACELSCWRPVAGAVIATAGAFRTVTLTPTERAKPLLSVTLAVSVWLPRVRLAVEPIRPSLLERHVTLPLRLPSWTSVAMALSRNGRLS
jgi:hypothetical protein